MAPARVLVVDDSPTMRGLISAVLNSDPEVNVIGQASDAMEARAAIKELNPDVVTLDIEMPNMNGLDMIRALRQSPAHTGIPIIFLTTESDADMKSQAKAAGATGWITKPFDPEQLVKIARKVLGR